MKILLFLVVSLITSTTFAERTKSARCEDSDFLQLTWGILVNNEPQIEKFLGELGKATGDNGPEVRVTNCWVSWPTDEAGAPVDGIRTVVIDKVWYEPNQPSDRPPRSSQGGMKIIYDRKRSRPVFKTDGSVVTIISRPILGLSFCRSALVCQQLAIPFPAAEPRKPESGGVLVPVSPEPTRESKSEDASDIMS